MKKIIITLILTCTIIFGTGYLHAKNSKDDKDKKELNKWKFSALTAFYDIKNMKVIALSGNVIDSIRVKNEDDIIENDFINKKRPYVEFSIYIPWYMTDDGGILLIPTLTYISFCKRTPVNANNKEGPHNIELMDDFYYGNIELFGFFTLQKRKFDQTKMDLPAIAIGPYINANTITKLERDVISGLGYGLKFGCGPYLFFRIGHLRIINDYDKLPYKRKDFIEWELALPIADNNKMAFVFKILNRTTDLRSKVKDKRVFSLIRVVMGVEVDFVKAFKDF